MRSVCRNASVPPDKYIMSEIHFEHKPVLFKETIESLNIDPEGTYIDGTAGGGGHSGAILQRLTTGTLLSIDRDPDAIAVVKERFGKYPGSVVAMGNFCDMDKIALEHGIVNVDGVLLDIGVSSYQLDTAERGFSYHADAPLDMRMSQSGTSAADLVNTLSWQELAEIISRYGEDKSAVRIAKGIVKAREEKPIETTLELAEIIREINRQGITVLLIEQNANMALKIADWAYVMQTGSILMQGPGEELAANEEVKAAYLGTAK